jgi:hypothetical protein
MTMLSHILNTNITRYEVQKVTILVQHLLNNIKRKIPLDRDTL